MKISIESSWKRVLNDEFEKTYFENLTTFVGNQYAQFTCYPSKSDIFRAFKLCPYASTKVVIIGQDPYHGPNQANGLCFSVNDGFKHPPSLVNIFKEMTSDLGVHYPKTGDLRTWAEQGVLLLNATLTVRANEAGSHQNKGWETFTDNVIKALNKHPNPIVYLLWGSFAKKKKKIIDTNKHMILESGHPSPLSANRGLWFGNKHFSKTNYLLEQAALGSIDWSYF